MGCDIHVFPEILTDNGWDFLGPMPRDLFDIVHPPHPESWKTPEAQEKFYNAWYQDWHDMACQWSLNRNYRLFATLADVRNSESLWEAVGYKIEPLYAHRGLPDDVNGCCRDMHQNVDLHSTTWATLRELYHEGLAACNPRGWLEFLELLTNMAGGPQIVMDEIGFAPAGIDRVRVIFSFDN